jgi:hypothetical protein
MNPFLTGKKKEDPTLDAMFIDAGFDTDDHIIIPNKSYPLKGIIDTDFAKAARFLSSYTPKKSYIIFDDTEIKFFEDEIQIGNTLIPLYKLSSPKYYNSFDSDLKSTIINIFISINR